LEIALFEPRIPQNTGSIARTCAAFNLPLNLIEPLGFSLDDKYLKRAGLDYWHLLEIEKFKNFYEFYKSKEKRRIISFSKKNGVFLNEFIFENDDTLLFGREDKGLPDEIINQSSALVSIYMPKKVRNPNLKDGVRSLNLSVACGIAIYEANKQLTKKNYQ
tara:strand:+ start:7 stop:489 length:483 start_codon:yes stop_codon:yes gene_type:complete